MGCGNFFPNAIHTCNSEGDFVYLDFYDEVSDDPDYNHEVSEDMLFEYIKEALESVGDITVEDEPYYKTIVKDDYLVFGEHDYLGKFLLSTAYGQYTLVALTDLYDLDEYVADWIDNAEWSGTFVTKQEANSKVADYLALMRNLGEKVFNYLHENTPVDVRVRTSAWTSAPYKP